MEVGVDRGGSYAQEVGAWRGGESNCQPAVAVNRSAAGPGMEA